MSEETRGITKEDYARIYRLLESGNTTREDICKAYGISEHTLYCRLREDRPALAEKLKKRPTGKKVPLDAGLPMEKVVASNGERVRRSLSKVIGHDLGVLAAKVDEQEHRVLEDPNFVPTLIGMEHAKNIKALAQAAAMVPGMGMQSGTNAQVSITQNVLNHASIMRVEGGGVLALELPAEAFVIEDATPPDNTTP